MLNRANIGKAPRLFSEVRSIDLSGESIEPWSDSGRFARRLRHGVLESYGFRSSATLIAETNE
jgi:hypothetical protein